MEKYNTAMALIGAAGSVLAAAFGGWDAGLSCLLAAMAVDYVTGLIVAGVFHNSPKSQSGSLESRAGWKGLFRKGGTLLVLLLAVQLDTFLNSSIVRDGVVIAYIANELISITENLGLMGVQMPAVIVKAIDILREKEENSDH